MPYPLLLATQRRLAAKAVASSAATAMPGQTAKTMMKATTYAASRCFSTKPQEMETFLSGTSGLYAEQMYEQYSEDPNSVHPSWKQYFDNLQEGIAFNQEDYSRPSVVPSKRAVAVSGVSARSLGETVTKKWL